MFTTVADPVQIGLVGSLSRPGGNLTGVTSLHVQVGPKRLELLHELLPAATDMALLINPNYPTSETQSKQLQAAAQTLGLRLHIRERAPKAKSTRRSRTWPVASR